MKHLLKSALFLSFLLFTVIQSFACSCIPVEDFCSSMYDNNYIFLGVVGDSITELKISIDVLGPIHQDIAYDQIELFGGGGFEASCIAGLEDLTAGDTLILSLIPAGNLLAGTSVEDQITDSTFIRSFCGIHKLEFSQGEVLGPIYPTVESMDYNAFVGEVALCIDFPSSINNPDAGEPEFYVLPNPAITSFRVESPTVDIEMVELYTVAGQKLAPLQSNEQRFAIVNTDQLAAGVYLLRVTFVDQRVGVRRVVVAS
ncbi:MAG: T9SS type A sorting domain-containing protein [Bacteroidota bacterium]